MVALARMPEWLEIVRHSDDAAQVETCEELQPLLDLVVEYLIRRTDELHRWLWPDRVFRARWEVRR